MKRMQHPYDTVIDAFATKNIPQDLVVCYLWTVATVLSIYLPLLNETFVRVIFGVPMVLFIPGYALIAALFPGAKDIDGIERVALSFGLSIAVVPLIGLALNYTPWGIRLDPLVVSLSIFTICMCLVAQYRRVQVSPEERFSVPFRALGQSAAGEFFPKESSRLDRVLSLILLAAIIAAVITTVYMIVVPKEGEKFTEFFILGENQKAADYPTRLVVGQNSSLYIGIGNHEYRNISYTVETYLVSMSFDEKTNTSSLQAMDRLARFTVPVSHNQTHIISYGIVPRKTGYNRIEFLLFNDTIPNDRVTGMDRINRSYRDLHLWVTVRSMS
jgi:uncharacterized membrane protein